MHYERTDYGCEKCVDHKCSVKCCSFGRGILAAGWKFPRARCTMKSWDGVMEYELQGGMKDEYSVAMEREREREKDA